MKMRLNKAAFEQFRKGESLDEIATRANIGQATLYRILRGKPFHSETVDSLAMALGCNSLDLLEVQRDEDEPPPLVGAPAVVSRPGTKVEPCQRC